MQILRQSTSVSVMLGPFVNSSDGVTTEESLTLTQSDLQLSKNGGAAAQKNDATSATHIYGGNYSVPLDATDTGTLGSLTLMCKKSGALPVKADFIVVTANVYDTLFSTDKLDVEVSVNHDKTGYSLIQEFPANFADLAITATTGKVTVGTNDDKTGYSLTQSFPANFADLTITPTTGKVTVGTNDDKTGYSISGTKTTLDDLNDISTGDVNTEVTNVLSTTTVKADIESISGDTIAADNLESQYDGTGLIGDNYPANQKQVGLISSGAAAIATTAESATITTGTETGTYANTVEADETFHIVEPSGGVTDFYYQFDIGPNALPVGIDWEGYANGQGDKYESYAWNWTSSSWEQIGTCEGINGTSLRTMSRILTAAHVGTSGGDVGKVRFRIYSTTGSKIATDRLLCTYSIVAPTATEIRTEMEDTGTKLSSIDSHIQTDITADILGHLDVDVSSRAPAHEYDTEMARITDNVATEAKQDIAQSDLDTITGADGVVLASSQPNYAPNTVVPDPAGTAPTAEEIRAEMEKSGTKLSLVLEDTNELQTNQGNWVTATTVALNTQGKADVKAEVDAALEEYDPPTKAELDIAESNIRGSDSDTLKTISDQIDNLNDPSASAIADAVWDEAIADHTTSTTFGGKNQKGVPSETVEDYKADVSGLAVEANVETHVTNSLNSYDPPTRAELTNDKNAIISEVNANGAKIDALNDLSAEEVNAEVADVLKTDTVAEMSQGAPPATPTMEQILNYLYRKFRNKTETTATEDAVYDDAGTTKLFKSTISDDGETFTKGKYKSGA